LGGQTIAFYRRSTCRRGMGGRIATLRELQFDLLGGRIEFRDAEAANLSAARAFGLGSCAAALSAFPAGLQHRTQRGDIRLVRSGLLLFLFFRSGFGGEAAGSM